MTTAVLARPSLRRRMGDSALVRNRAAVLGLIILVPMLIAAFVPWLLTSADPNAQDLSNSLAAPSWAHPLGTDKSIIRSIRSRNSMATCIPTRPSCASRFRSRAAACGRFPPN